MLSENFKRILLLISLGVQICTKFCRFWNLLRSAFYIVIEEANKICLAKGEIHVHIDMNSTNYINIVHI